MARNQRKYIGKDEKKPWKHIAGILGILTIFLIIHQIFLNPEILIFIILSIFIYIFYILNLEDIGENYFISGCFIMLCGFLLYFNMLQIIGINAWLIVIPYTLIAIGILIEMKQADLLGIIALIGFFIFYPVSMYYLLLINTYTIPNICWIGILLGYIPLFYSTIFLYKSYTKGNLIQDD